MLGIHYIKTASTQYVMHYLNGRLKRSGTGLAFYYYKPASMIAVIPISSADVPFIFNEMSADFQLVTVQGSLTYRINNPQLVASLLDYTVSGAPEHFITEDPQKLPQRLANLLQVTVRGEVQRLPLRKALQSSEGITAAVLANIQEEKTISSLGVEILALSIQAIKPIPEMARALEAEAREELLRRADQAIYDRRNASVEQERRIKENELNTEIAVEEKKRQIRENKVEADLSVEAKEQQVREKKIAGQITLEVKRKQLVAAMTENARTQADVQAYATEASLRPLRDLDPAVIQMLTIRNADPRLMVSLAFKEIAQNAGKIGNLTISPDLLEGLIREQGNAKREG